MDSRFQEAIRLRDSGCFTAALGLIDQVLENAKDPRERAILLLNKVGCFLRLSNIADARKAWAEAMRECPSDPFLVPQFQLADAVIEESAGNKDSALRKLEGILNEGGDRLQSPSLRFIYEDVQLRRGLILVTRGEYTEADQLLSEAEGFDLSEDDRRLLLCNRAFCRQQLGDFSAAAEYYREGVRRGIPQDWLATVKYNLGVVYYRLGRYREAKQVFGSFAEEATKHGYPLTNIYKWLSAICERLGERQEAGRYARLAAKQ